MNLGVFRCGNRSIAIIVSQFMYPLCRHIRKSSLMYTRNILTRASV